MALQYECKSQMTTIRRPAFPARGKKIYSTTTTKRNKQIDSYIPYGQSYNLLTISRIFRLSWPHSLQWRHSHWLSSLAPSLGPFFFLSFFLPCGGSNGFVLGLPQQRQQPAIVSRLPAAAVTNTRYPLSWLDYTSPSSQFQLINQASTLSIQTNTNEPNHRPKRNTSIYIYIYIYIKKQNKQQQKKNTHVLKLH